MHEIETKVLEVNVRDITQRLLKLGAKKILNTRLIADWFHPAGTKEGQDKWFLRIRKDSEGNGELTWKSMPKKSKIHKRCREINLKLDNPEKTEEFLLAIGLKKYAHQEKDRISWIYKKWRFDMDKYPGMPSYLEIEGQSQKHIKEAIKLLNLTKHKASPEGERVLIQKEYGLNWYTMKFKND
jgi:adenylate cyclase, class 2